MIVDVGANVIPLIKSVYSSLTKAEKKVANVVLNETESILYASISDFAEMAGVGDTTVLRFCRKINFKGYQGFKMAIAQELAIANTKGIKQLNDEIYEDDSLDDIIHKTLIIQDKALNDTVKLLNIENVEKSISAIAKARKNYFYGLGSSGIIALAAKNKFLRIGINAYADIDSHIQAMTASLLSEDDVAVGISFSGSSIDTVKNLEIAKNAGAKIICITHHANSPITRYSDIVLLTGAKEAPLQGGDVSAQIAQLFVISILYNGVFLKLKNQSIKNKEKTCEAVLDKLY
ncbi:MurR/RpiR family transcriptional regulator [Clostridium sediminicola]|uniref:MurR/RpiR family transcriptional regulator n=1 Tax=Clostridium sediminicola TaxID=3114879 RepID=UPI0031F209A8